MFTNLPITARMHPDQFRALVAAFYDDADRAVSGESLSTAYHLAEIVHRHLLGCECYPGGYESFRQEYYRKHPTRKG